MTQLFLDCDGVLADFDAAFTAQFGHPPRAYEEQKGSATFWRDIQHEAKDFYRHLPLMADARALYNAVSHLRPIILTGCPLGGWAEAQKLAWAAEHFPGVPMITCMSKDKRTYCRPGDILIDDYLKYRHLWEEAGGVFIHHTSAASSIAALTASPASHGVVTKEMVNAAWNKAKDLRLTGLPSDFRQVLEAALAALAPSLAEQGVEWKPIDTAPREGTLILLSCTDWPPSVHLGKPFPVKVGGWWDGMWHVFGASWTPTDWKPLPAPPAAAPEQEKAR